MKPLIMAIFLSVGLSGSAWCQTAMPKTASDLARYLGADRERLLLEGSPCRPFEQIAALVIAMIRQQPGLIEETRSTAAELMAALPNFTENAVPQ